MDKKAVINGLVAMVVVFGLWQVAIKFFIPPQQPLPQTETADTTATQPVGAVDDATESNDAPSKPQTLTANNDDDVAAPPAAAPDKPLTTQEAYAVSADEEEVHLGRLPDNADDPNRLFPMELRLTSRGAAIRELLLSDYNKEVRTKRAARKPYLLVQPAEDADGKHTHYSLATGDLVLFHGDDSTTVNLENVDWKVIDDGTSKSAAAFQTTVLEQGKPALKLIKRYELPEQPRQKGNFSGRHNVRITLSVENVTDHEVSFSLTQLGPIGVERAMLRSKDRHMYAAYRKGNDVSVDRVTRANLGKKPHAWDVDRDGERLMWTAIDNQYFACILAPAGQDAAGFSDLWARVEAKTLGHPVTGFEAGDMTPALVMARQTLPAGDTLTAELDCYFGPKSRPIFLDKKDNPDYVAREYVDLIEKNYSGCTFAWLANIMIAILNFFGGKVFGNYGVAIIVLVLIVRTLLHPLTKKQQIDMTKMQRKMASIQPKLEEAKKKYANDKAKQQEETMKVYREEGMNPAGQLLTCLPMMLQMPIWVALWTALNTSIEMRHAPFIFWIHDLTAPDELIKFSHPYTIPLLSAMIGEVRGFNLLPLLLSVTMYVQQKFMPKASKAIKRENAPPDQMAQQQQIMKFMLVFFGVLFYNAPSGLCLYIMCSNIFGMFEQWRIRKHLKDEEEKGTFDFDKKKKDGKKRSGWLAKLEKMAENARKQQYAGARRK